MFITVIGILGCCGAIACLAIHFHESRRLRPTPIPETVPREHFLEAWSYAVKFRAERDQWRNIALEALQRQREEG